MQYSANGKSLGETMLEQSPTRPGLLSVLESSLSGIATRPISGTIELFDPFQH